MDARSLMTKDLEWISPDAAVAEAAARLAAAPPGVICLLVGDGAGAPAGVVTAVDILRAVMRTGLSPGRLACERTRGRALRAEDLACDALFSQMAGAAVRTPVREVMSSPVVCAREDMTAGQAMDALIRNRIESMPVYSGGRVVGMVHRRALLGALGRTMAAGRA